MITVSYFFSLVCPTSAEESWAKSKTIKLKIQSLKINKLCQNTNPICSSSMSCDLFKTRAIQRWNIRWNIRHTFDDFWWSWVCFTPYSRLDFHSHTTPKKFSLFERQWLVVLLTSHATVGSFQTRKMVFHIPRARFRSWGFACWGPHQWLLPIAHHIQPIRPLLQVVNSQKGKSKSPIWSELDWTL